MTNSELLLYQTEDGQTKIDVRLEEETVWLTIGQMGQLFQKSRSTMNDDILKQAGDGNYFDELLARIRDICSSEKVFWRKAYPLSKNAKRAFQSVLLLRHDRAILQ